MHKLYTQTQTHTHNTQSDNTRELHVGISHDPLDMSPDAGPKALLLLVTTALVFLLFLAVGLGCGAAVL